MSEWKLVPAVPTEALLRSMAARYTHDFGLLGPNQQQMLMTMMRQIHEEVVGAGFYRAPSPEWVKTSDRLPTREDADESGHVWCAGWPVRGRPVVTSWSYDRAGGFDYWMPKPRVQPPEPPEVK